MLVDNFREGLIREIYSRAAKLSGKNNLHLLIDGAFLSGIHRLFRAEEKRILFETLPSCNDVTRDASPFLIQIKHPGPQLDIILDRFSGWPMISLIETRESLGELANRLALWCIVDVDNERFNLRFADTRRLPAIVKIFSPRQRAQFFGPAIRCSVIDRDGNLAEVEIGERHQQHVSADFTPAFDNLQFAALLNDGRADEILAVMKYRGEEPSGTYSQRWAAIVAAINVAVSASLDESDLVEWAIWYAKTHHFSDDQPAGALQTWLGAQRAMRGEKKYSLSDLGELAE